MKPIESLSSGIPSDEDENPCASPSDTPSKVDKTPPATSLEGPSNEADKASITLSTDPPSIVDETQKHASSDAASKASQAPHSKDDLDVLRRLILSPEQKQLSHIQERMDDPLIRAEEMSQTLPDAISLRSARDNKIGRTLRPTIEETLRASVKKNPKALADAIFPIMGPGIRKAIVSTIMGMIQSLNQLLNHSFSIRGLKWRFEALRTRRPFAEVILLHTLVYRVEQIFIIHRETGVVLHHVESLETKVQDPDLVSGMLTAIQDFVNDSFHSDAGVSLDTLRMGGDKSVWIEQGVHAFLAAVIQGTPPLNLRENFRGLLADVHETLGETLVSFKGDVTPFAIFKDKLEDMLLAQAKDPKIRISPVLVIIIAVLLAGLSFWGYYAYLSHQTWQRYLEQVRSETGLVITDSGKRGGKYYITGLRDPMSRDPDGMISQYDLYPDEVISKWAPYYALDHRSVLKRVRHRLEPPTSVNLSLKDGYLFVTGSANHSWILDFRRRIWTIPGVNGIDESKLFDKDLHNLDAARVRLDQLGLFFQSGSSEVEAGQETELQALMELVQDIQRLSFQLDIPVQIVIIGNTDARGRNRFNLQLSSERAESILRYLITNGINPSNITTIGSGTRDKKQQSALSDKNRLHRMVTFKTFVQTSLKAKTDD